MIYTEPILLLQMIQTKLFCYQRFLVKNIDEVFIGSCMTNIGHIRAAGKLLNTHNDTLSTSYGCRTYKNGSTKTY